MTARPRIPNVLWAGLHCPALPLAAAWRLAPGNAPRAVHERRAGQARIVLACDRASGAGVAPGQGLAAALALEPALHSRPRDRAAEHQALGQIALAAYRHSHQVALAPPETVLVEVAGSRRLYGGLASVLGRLRDELAAQGFDVRLGSAPFPAAARLLARTGRHAADRGGLEQILAGLPLAALGLEPDSSRALAGCGLETTGELMALPAAERARRFGPELNRFLDEIRGRRPTPLAGWRPPERFELRLEMPVTTASTEALLFAINRGLYGLGDWLEVRGLALARLEIGLFPEQGAPPRRLSVGLARPGFERARVLELVRLKLEEVALSSPVAALVLSAETAGEHRPPQAELFDGGTGDAWPALLDRLAARLGEEAVCGLSARPDHRPERAWRWTRPGAAETPCDAPPRPTWLLPEPRPCRVENLALEEGPERIETGWWDGADCRRDYWTATDRHGRRLWVFREYKPREGWFVHGVFG